MSHLQSASASLYVSAFGITVDLFHCRLGKLVFLNSEGFWEQGYY
jgi:hypothetical protein